MSSQLIASRMIATLTVTPTSPIIMNGVFTRDSNLAGAPLPTIPRRTSSGSRIPTAKPSTITATMNTDPRSEAKPKLYSLDGTGSLSSPPELSSQLKKRRMPSPPPEVALPTLPSLKPRKESHRRSQSHPNVLTFDTKNTISASPTEYSFSVSGSSLNLDGLKTRNLSESHAQYRAPIIRVKSAPLEKSQPPQVVRKKSGQIVRSSLKSSKSFRRGSLSVVTGGISSKSEPTTPCKAVHFDERLEQVKLFLAEQKPLAVSRDGSPTDTSGTESDFPSLYPGDSPGPLKRSKLQVVMRLVNMPPAVNQKADVALEELKLAEDFMSILGRVRVRNLAFQKWVTVRFTLDSWQTISEVAGKYVESIDKDTDVFSFSIRLDDILARIEGKTLMLAVRYSIEGREMWDNNRGNNYVAVFSKAAPQMITSDKPSSRESSAGDADDLRMRLENVVQRREQGRDGTSVRHLTKFEENLPLLSESGSLASRYDFETSLKSPWKPQEPTLQHSRSQSYPLVTPSFIPWPEKGMSTEKNRGVMPTTSLGSPRDHEDGDEIFRAYRHASDPPSLTYVTRNHRRAYFDVAALKRSGVRKTPPGPPRTMALDDSVPGTSRMHTSFPDISRPAPLLDVGLELGLSAGDGSASDMSTPSILSPSSSSSMSSLSSPLEALLLSGIEDPSMTSPNVNYSQFLDRFCFYTGSGSLSTSPSQISTPSAMIQNVLVSSSPHLRALARVSPVRETQDDIGIRSGSATPTRYNFALAGSRSPTPVIG